METLKLTTILLIAAISGSFGQSKPRKVIIHKYQSIRKDSTIYLPDTIACYFKELVIQPDTVYEKWNKGFVVWQTWSVSYNTWANGTTTGTLIWSGMQKDPEPIEYRYRFSEVMAGKFLYSNYKPVTNKVMYAIAR